MNEFVEIGQAVFSCPRCGEPRHVVVEAICRPFAAADTKPWQATLNGVVVGSIHLALRNQPDQHVCGVTPKRRHMHLVPGEKTH